MKTEEEIEEKIEWANKQAEENYKYGNWADMTRWNSFASALEWVLEESEE